MNRYDLMQRLASQLDMVEKFLRKEIKEFITGNIDHKKSICETCHYQSVGLFADHAMKCTCPKYEHVRIRSIVVAQCPHYMIRSVKDGVSEEA